MNRLKIILKEDRTLHEMIAGILAVNLVLAGIAYLIMRNRESVTAVAIGAAIAIIYVIHMAVSVDDALCLDEKGAATQLRKSMIFRYLFVCIAFGLSIYLKIADPIFLTISVITIKAGAYLQPFIHKHFGRREDN